eukprot:scaffold20612_cov179-Skeletonema_dohrnii-CCMP3373.AAC.4
MGIELRGDAPLMWMKRLDKLRVSVGGSNVLLCGWESPDCKKRANQKCSLGMCKKHCQQSYALGMRDGECKERTHRLDVTGTGGN